MIKNIYILLGSLTSILIGGFGFYVGATVGETLILTMLVYFGVLFLYKNESSEK